LSSDPLFASCGGASLGRVDVSERRDKYLRMGMLLTVHNRHAARNWDLRIAIRRTELQAASALGQVFAPRPHFHR
jgi:hypothetical protein